MECPICYEKYGEDTLTAPRVLKCGHTICSMCICVLNECPFCKRIIQKTSFEFPPINYSLLEMLRNPTVREEKNEDPNDNDNNMLFILIWNILKKSKMLLRNPRVQLFFFFIIISHITSWLHFKLLILLLYISLMVGLPLLVLFVSTNRQMSAFIRLKYSIIVEKFNRLVTKYFEKDDNLVNVNQIRDGDVFLLKSFVSSRNSFLYLTKCEKQTDTFAFFLKYSGFCMRLKEKFDNHVEKQRFRINAMEDGYFSLNCVETNAPLLFLGTFGRRDWCRLVCDTIPNAAVTINSYFHFSQIDGEKSFFITSRNGAFFTLGTDLSVGQTFNMTEATKFYLEIP
jgi:hypothetical protein